jgi:hypothetical protein
MVLSGDLAIVLLALVARLNQDESVLFEDQAEQRALWDLEALLEAAIPAVLSPDFTSSLQSARERLRDDE